MAFHHVNYLMLLAFLVMPKVALGRVRKMGVVLVDWCPKFVLELRLVYFPPLLTIHASHIQALVSRIPWTRGRTRRGFDPLHQAQLVGSMHTTRSPHSQAVSIPMSTPDSSAFSSTSKTGNVISLVKLAAQSAQSNKRHPCQNA